MKQRTVTAVVFAIAMLGGVFGGATAFFILFALITAGCLWELMGLLFAAESNHLRLRQVLGTVLGIIPFLACGGAVLGFTQSGIPALQTNSSFPIFTATILALVFLLFILELFLHSDQPFANISHYLLGLDSALADNISANVVGLVLGTLFRFWSYRKWVFPEVPDDPADHELAERDAATPI